MNVFWSGVKKENFDNLRAIVTRDGAKIEQLSYEELIELSEEDFEWPETEYQSHIVSFEGECTIQKNGDLLYFMHLNCDAATPFGVKPGYHFYKKKDQSVYY